MGFFGEIDAIARALPISRPSQYTVSSGLKENPFVPKNGKPFLIADKRHTSVASLIFNAFEFQHPKQLVKLF
jgi:hypothetical protein